jgi:hypothetical protein
MIYAGRFKRFMIAFTWQIITVGMGSSGLPAL